MSLGVHNNPEVDQLIREFVAWSFQLHQMPTTEAAEQFLRTRVHPELHAGINRLQQLIQKESLAFVRRVVDRVGYDRLIDLYPASADIVEKYKQSGTDNRHLISTALLLAAYFDTEIIHRLVAATMAERTRAQLQERLDIPTHSHRWTNVIQPEVFWREVDDILRSAGEHSALHVGQPTHVEEVEPVVVHVNAEEGATRPYRINSRVRLFDAVRHKYDVEVDRPVPAQQYEVDSHISIPIDRAQNGLLIEMSIEHASDWQPGTARLYLKPEEIASLQWRGSAVPIYIGRGQHVELHPELVDGADLPNAPLVAIRMRPHSAEIMRLPVCSRLTVSV